MSVNKGGVAYCVIVMISGLVCGWGTRCFGEVVARVFLQDERIVLVDRFGTCVRVGIGEGNKDADVRWLPWNGEWAREQVAVDVNDDSFVVFKQTKLVRLMQGNLGEQPTPEQGLALLKELFAERVGDNERAQVIGKGRLIGVEEANEVISRSAASSVLAAVCTEGGTIWLAFGRRSGDGTQLLILKGRNPYGAIVEERWDRLEVRASRIEGPLQMFPIGGGVDLVNGLGVVKVRRGNDGVLAASHEDVPRLCASLQQPYIMIVSKAPVSRVWQAVVRGEALLLVTHDGQEEELPTELHGRGDAILRGLRMAKVNRPWFEE